MRAACALGFRWAGLLRSVGVHRSVTPCSRPLRTALVFTQPHLRDPACPLAPEELAPHRPPRVEARGPARSLTMRKTRRLPQPPAPSASCATSQSSPHWRRPRPGAGRRRGPTATCLTERRRAASFSRGGSQWRHCSVSASTVRSPSASAQATLAGVRASGLSAAGGAPLAEAGAEFQAELLRQLGAWLASEASQLYQASRAMTRPRLVAAL